MRPVTPRGFRDVLAGEAAERGAIEGMLESAFESAGYGRVQTPVVETARALEAGAGASLEGRALFVQDTDGTLLALRPEMTVPIARLVATRLRDESAPVRVAYVADVFREQASLRGQAREFTQAGVELIGVGGPEADAEIVVVLVEALEAAGLDDFSVAIGTVGVLLSLLDAAGARGDQRRELLDAAHRRDRVAWARLLDDAAFEPAIDAALRMPTHMRGGVEVLEACHAMLAPCGCVGALEALDELAATMELLEAAGVAGRVKADLGVIRDFDYYTGLVVEAYAPGLGVPLGGGGRYDAVLAAFDAPAPAAGFAIGVERLHIALADQGRLPSVAPLDAVVGGTDATSVFAAAARLRAQGWRVTQCCNGSRTEVVASAAERGAACALWAQAGSLGTLGPDGAVSGALDLADLPEPPSGALAGTLGAVR